MGILTQNTRDLSTTQKPPKIPDYAKDYKNEYLFIRGIDQCFKYFADNFETNSKHGDFFTKKFQKMTKYIRQSEYHQGLFNLKTTCRLFEPNDIHYAYDLYKKITYFIEETVINDGAQDEEEWETYVFENYPGFDKMMEYTERFLDLYGIIGIDEDKDYYNNYESSSDDDN